MKNKICMVLLLFFFFTVISYSSQEQNQIIKLSLLDKDIKEQLMIFAACREEWIIKDYDPFLCGYTVYDLDEDGMLELISHVTAGTALIAKNTFYHADTESGEINVLKQVYNENFFMLNLEGKLEFYQDTESGKKYYLSSYKGKSGIEYICADGFFYLEDGYVYNETIRSYFLYARGKDNDEYHYYDENGNEISESKWEEKYTNFFKNKEGLKSGTSWMWMYYEDAMAATEMEILFKLYDIYVQGCSD